MRLRVIATDYDGTIAVDGVIDRAVRKAIQNARERGLLVVIVSGRILSELREITGGLQFVDGVVAENGAVVYLANGHTVVLGESPPIALISELTQRGIDFKVGRCVVEMDAGFANVAIELIRKLELPLAITFNRSRMMLLPASISKSGGLRELLAILGVSVHNAVGIGDAENDHELLSVCEQGVAVSWGSERLKAEADVVIEGDGPAAVAEYIDRISTDIRLPLVKSRHRKLILEEVEGRAPLAISVCGRNMLLAGDTKSGKSWIAGLFIEQKILQDYTVYIFDPEGDYSSLASLPNTIALGGGRMLPKFDDLNLLLQQGVSVILNMSHLTYDEKADYIRHHLPLVAKHRRSRGYPHRILLDECHYYLNQSGSKSLLDSEMEGYTFVTYKPSQLSAAIMKSVGIVVVTRLADREEVDAVRGIMTAQSQSNPVDSHDWYDQLAKLSITEAAILPPTYEAEGRLRRFIVAPRLTIHVRHRSKYFDIPVPAERAFVFTEYGQSVGETTSTLRQLATSAEQVSDKVLQGHIRKHDFSRWVSALFGDHSLSDQIRQLESRYKDRDPLDGFATEMCEMIEKRYERS